MLAKLYSSAIVGLDAVKVTVEVDLGKSVHKFIIVGLPDAAISESTERVTLAIKNSGAKPPYTRGRLVVNLAPADLKKEGPAYDLPMAMGFLKTSGQVDFAPEKKMFVGELALDGSTRPITGILPRAILAKKLGLIELYLPKENAAEASLVSGLKIYPVENLAQIIDHFNGEELIPIFDKKNQISKEPPAWTNDLDFSFVKGQEQAKRALEVAAAGGHNVLMSGAPGSGKTMLAKTLPSILPEMNEREQLEVTKIFSVAGRLSTQGLVSTRPFRSPHHSASGVSLVGGGTLPKPGEISLAHRGVLFLDELPEFDRKVLESLRQPLEDGEITITRANGVAKFPALFILVASMNPCPCGYLGDSEKECVCSPVTIARYQKTISGPLLDRIDMAIEVPRLPYEKIRPKKNQQAEKSIDIRKRVNKARDRQAQRYKEEKFLINSEITPKTINKYCALDSEAETILKTGVTTMNLSARSINRILKVARTIADLSEKEKIQPEHVAEAIQYRKGFIAER